MTGWGVVLTMMFRSSSSSPWSGHPLILPGSWDLWQLYWCSPPWCLSSPVTCPRRPTLRLWIVLDDFDHVGRTVFSRDFLIVLYQYVLGDFWDDFAVILWWFPPQLIDMWLLFFIISTTINICIHIIVDWLRKEELEKKRESENTQVRPMTVKVSWTKLSINFHRIFLNYFSTNDCQTMILFQCKLFKMSKCEFLRRSTTARRSTLWRRRWRGGEGQGWWKQRFLKISLTVFAFLLYF